MRNYLPDMLYALTSAYSRRDYDNQQQGLPVQTNIGKLFSIFAWGLDIVHENAELVKLWDDLEQAKGAVLDRYGANWGVQRFSENDALYRLAIRVKILSQLSGGDTDTVIRAAADLLGVEDPDIGFEDVFPAKIALYVDWLLLTDERQELIEPIAWAIKRIVAAGVGFRLYIRTYREYRHDLPISHGGATGANIIAAPVGQDRESIEDIRVSFGAFMEAPFAPPPIGRDRKERGEWIVHHGSREEAVLVPPLVSQDRTGREEKPIRSGIFLHPNITPTPVGQDRTERGGLEILHSGISETDFLPPPVGEDRTGYEVKPVHSGMLARPELAAPPVGEDRESQRTVTATHAAADVPLVKGHRDRQEGASGTIYRTHIKPKRID